MISLAARRHPGLAMRPALFLFALLMPLVLLAGCRQQGEWLTLEGVALGTGYHITLNGDLGEGEPALVEAAIQGELAGLEAESESLQRLLRAGRPALVDTSAMEKGLEAIIQAHRARAVDRLAGLLGEFGVAHALIELGGAQRALGMAGRHPWRVRLPRTGLEAEDPSLRLEDAALASRSAPRPPGGSDAAAERILAVSVVAGSAEAADRLALELLASPLEAAMEQPARLVVLTSRGITLHIGAGLEPLLER